MSAAAAADAQFRLFDAVSRCLAGLAADRPVVVVLDDLHWADEPSLRLLGFLARALTAKAVLLLGAYRDTEASPELHELAGTAQQLALAGLTPGEVEAMARELAEAMAEPRPSSQVTSQLWQRSGGNPFFVRELTRLLVAQGSWHEHTQIPASVAETLRRRLARLSTGCVRLLEWAAVAGRDIDLSLLTRGEVAADEAAILGLLDEARHAGVIAGTSPPRFTHDLYRETILDGLAAPARAAVNLSVGRALQARSGPAARVAAHLLAAGAPAQQDALEYSLLAAREATARLGHEDACAHYLRALQIIDDGGASGGAAGERTEILLQLAASHERAGNSDLAMQRFLEAADASRAAGDAVGLATAALGVQTLGHRSGAQNAELLGLLREASEQLAASARPVGLAVPGARGAGPHDAARIGPPAWCRGHPDRAPGRGSWPPPPTTRAPWRGQSSPFTTRCGHPALPRRGCPSLPRCSTPRRPAATTISSPRRTFFAPRPCLSSESRPDVMSCSPTSPWQASWVMPVAVGEH